jgi:hypothetical protein
MAPSVHVVKRVENDIKLLEVLNRELRVLDVCMMRDNGNGGVELGGGFFGDLRLRQRREVARRDRNV